MFAGTEVRATRQRGVAAVEFAIVLPLLLMVAFGIVEFGRAMYEYDSLVKNARAAARYLSSADPEVGENRNRAVCIVKAADPYATCFGANPPVNPTPAPWLAPLAAAQVDVYHAGNDSALRSVRTGTTTGTVDLVTVVVRNYQYRSLLLPFIPAIATFEPISATMVRLGA